MRDLPDTADLLGLARRLLLDELTPLLPPERERDAHLVATALAIAARELESGPLAELVELRVLYAPHPLPASGEREHSSDHRGPRPACGERERPIAERWEGEGQLAQPDLLARFAAHLRKGAFETSPSRDAAARAILWRMVIAKLRETNPHFLAANGFC